MKKIKWATHKNLFAQIAAISCLVGASAGVVFGVSAGTFKIQYVDLNNAEARLFAAKDEKQNYYIDDASTEWNNEKTRQPYSPFVNEDTKWWAEAHGDAKKWDESVPGLDADPNKMEREESYGTPISKEASAERKKYNAIVIDGATHTVLDRSFNQNLYNGLASFNQNVVTKPSEESYAQIYKPAQDNTTEFINVYRAAAKKARILCLAGFNHVTPLNALGKVGASGRFEFSDPNLQNTGLILIDGDIKNNQNLASVLFRSDQPAFLAALATAMYFYNNLGIYHDKYQDLTVAAYGGTAIPSVTVYMGGFQRGIEFFNQFILQDNIISNEGGAYINNGEPDVQSFGYFKKLLEYSKYKNEVEALKAQQHKKPTEVSALLDKMYDEYSIKMIDLGRFSSHFTGSFAEGDAIGMSKQLLNRGASAIIAVAGPQSLDTAKEIMNQKSNCIVIGVDSALETGDYQRPFINPDFHDKTKALDGSASNQANNIIKFSSVKDMGTVTTQILDISLKGKNWNVDNQQPWNPHTKIPNFAQDEILDAKEYLEVVEQANDTFRVIGFKKNNFPEKAKVLHIPLQMEINGKTCDLAQIGANDTDAPTYKFNSGNLKQFVCLKCDFVEGMKTVTLKHKAFNFVDGTKDSGFIYIDFGSAYLNELTFESDPSTGSDGEPFYKITKDGAESRSWSKGVFKNSSPDAENIYGKALGKYAGWNIVEADPMQAVGGLGYKTCGNIENGLISISWDGWYYLLEALKHLETVYFSASLSFMQLWKYCAVQYCLQHSNLDLAFQDLVRTDNWTELSTFNTDSILYKNYSHMMIILGMVMKRMTFLFPKDMTVVLDAEGKPATPEKATEMSLLDWLKINMYTTA